MPIWGSILIGIISRTGYYLSKAYREELLMKINFTAVGRRIQKNRKKKHISQEQLAFQISSSASYISNIERGVKKPSLQTLVEIAEVLGVTVNDFLYNTEEVSVLYDNPELSELLSGFSADEQKLLCRNFSSIIKTARIS